MHSNEEQMMIAADTAGEMAATRAAQATDGRQSCKDREIGISPNSIGGMPAQSWAARRVLVADDNPVNRQVAQQMVEKLGCQAEVAFDGVQAVALHSERQYDLILMDCEMPRLDGYQATQRIRALEGAVRHTPIIALTASDTQGEREKCLAGGMDGFIAKPVRPQLLNELLDRWLAPVTAERTSDAATGYGDELDVVRDMFGQDFAELATLYRKDSPPRIALLHQACAAQDYSQAAKVAHVFAGSSASIGATRLSALCKELETRAKANALNDFKERLAAIEAEYDRVSDRLRAMT